MQMSPAQESPRGLILPHPAIVALGLAFMRLAIAGLIAVGISGLVANTLGRGFGRSFVAGDPPGVTYTPARCADFLEYFPDARTCEEAATSHHFGEAVDYPIGAGLLGILLLAVYRLGRRRLHADAHVLPPGFEATIGTAVYGVAAVYLLGISLNGALLHETAGVGAPLSGGIVAVAMLAYYVIALYRLLLQRADRSSRAGIAS